MTASAATTYQYATPGSASQTIMWWAAMLTAVLAIPAIASLVVVALQPSGFGAIAVFVGSCWACVYAGIKLVKNPKITFPYMLEHISFTEEEKARTVATITRLGEDLDKWKRMYERCDTAFMNLAKQPAWGHLDELMQTLSNIKYTVSEERTIQFDDMRNLNSWLLSSKAATLEAYIHALRNAYVYGAAVAAEQGKDIDQMFPELEKGLLQQFEQTPSRIKGFAWELLTDVRKKYPFIAAQLNYAVAESRGHLKLVANKAA